MGEIVNLKARRKQRERAADAATSAGNRARHGRTRAERERDDTEAARRESVLDGARIEPDPPTGA